MSQDFMKLCNVIDTDAMYFYKFSFGKINRFVRKHLSDLCLVWCLSWYILVFISFSLFEYCVFFVCTCFLLCSALVEGWSRPWPLTWKTLWAMPNHTSHICAKFHWNPSTDKEILRHVKYVLTDGQWTHNSRPDDLQTSCLHQLLLAKKSRVTDGTVRGVLMTKVAPGCGNASRYVPFIIASSINCIFFNSSSPSACNTSIFKHVHSTVLHTVTQSSPSSRESEASRFRVRQATNLRLFFSSSPSRSECS